MQIVFAIEPGPRQRARIDSIRERASRYFPPPTYRVEFDEYHPSYLTILITVTVIPDPPYGPFGRHIVFPYESPLRIDWPEKSN
jgi:hypothetical protein